MGTQSPIYSRGMLIPIEEWNRWCAIHMEQPVLMRFGRTTHGYRRFLQALETGDPEAQRLQARLVAFRLKE